MKYLELQKAKALEKLIAAPLPSTATQADIDAAKESKDALIPRLQGIVNTDLSERKKPQDWLRNKKNREKVNTKKAIEQVRAALRDRIAAVAGTQEATRLLALQVKLVGNMRDPLNDPSATPEDIFKGIHDNFVHSVGRAGFFTRNEHARAWVIPLLAGIFAKREAENIVRSNGQNIATNALRVGNLVDCGSLLAPYAAVVGSLSYSLVLGMFGNNYLDTFARFSNAQPPAFEMKRKKDIIKAPVKYGIGLTRFAARGLERNSLKWFYKIGENSATKRMVRRYKSGLPARPLSIRENTSLIYGNMKYLGEMEALSNKGARLTKREMQYYKDNKATIEKGVVESLRAIPVDHRTKAMGRVEGRLQGDHGENAARYVFGAIIVAIIGGAKAFIFDSVVNTCKVLSKSSQHVENKLPGNAKKVPVVPSPLSAHEGIHPVNNMHMENKMIEGVKKVSTLTNTPSVHAKIPDNIQTPSVTPPLHPEVPVTSVLIKNTVGDTLVNAAGINPHWGDANFWSNLAIANKHNTVLWDNARQIATNTGDIQFLQYLSNAGYHQGSGLARPEVFSRNATILEDLFHWVYNGEKLNVLVK